MAGIKLGTAVFFASLSVAMARAETMNNGTVIALSKAGLSDGLIIDKVNSEPCGYDTSTSSIINMKQGGLSEAVIGAMVRRCASLASERGLAGDDASPDPMIRHSPGIYLVESWQTPPVLQVLRPSKSSGMKTSGNGSILFPLIAKMVLPGAQGHLPVETNNPTFYFYFNVSDAKVSDFGTENSIAAQSPDEFSLVKFKQKGDEREVEFGRASAYGGALVSMKKGIDTRVTIKFDAEDKGHGIFKVSLDKPLDTGEYGFIFTGANGTSRIYDFSIVAVPSTTKVALNN